MSLEAIKRSKKFINSKTNNFVSSYVFVYIITVVRGIVRKPNPINKNLIYL